MEVRLTEFAEIVGTTTATIRNAIQLNKLPFLDERRNDAESTGKQTRRTYSAEDAFAWYLLDVLGQVVPMGQWVLSGSIQSAWPRGLRLYVRDLLAGKASDKTLFVLVRGLPKAKDILSDRREWASHSFTITEIDPQNGESNIEKLRSKYPVVVTVDLDHVFDEFKLVLEGRGWEADENGLHPINGAD